MSLFCQSENLCHRREFSRNDGLVDAKLVQNVYEGLSRCRFCQGAHSAVVFFVRAYLCARVNHASGRKVRVDQGLVDGIFDDDHFGGIGDTLRADVLIKSLEILAFFDLSAKSLIVQSWDFLQPPGARKNF